MRGMYWEEWEVGAEFVSPARTVTETPSISPPRHATDAGLSLRGFGGGRRGGFPRGGGPPPGGFGRR